MLIKYNAHSKILLSFSYDICNHTMHCLIKGFIISVVNSCQLRELMIFQLLANTLTVL